MSPAWVAFYCAAAAALFAASGLCLIRSARSDAGPFVNIGAIWFAALGGFYVGFAVTAEVVR